MFAAGLLGSGVSAQTIIQPPIIHAVDQNGVNLATGAFKLPDLSVSIGGPSSGISRVGNGDGSDNWSNSFYLVGRGSGPVDAQVSYAGRTHIFYVGASYPAAGSISLSPGPWKEANGNAFLACNGNVQQVSPSWNPGGQCFLTLGDGTVVTYNMSIETGTNNFTDNTVNSPGFGIASHRGVMQSAVKPNGETVTATYYMDGSTANYARAINSISSNLGWMLQYQVDSNYAVTQVTAINTSAAYCSPTASSCAVASSFPTMSQTTSGGTTTLYRNGVSQGSYTVNGNTLTIKSPSGATKTVVYDVYGAAGRVMSVTIGSSTWNYSYGPYVNYGPTSVTVQEPNGASKTVTNNGNGITGVTDELNRTTTYSYSAGSNGAPGYLSSVQTPDGIKVNYTYDYRGNITQKQTIGKDGTSTLTESATYSEGPTVFKCVSPATCNEPLTYTDTAGITTTYTYYGFGGVKTATGPSVNNVQAETRYFYSSVAANLMNSSGALVVQSSVQLPSGTKACMSATLDTCAGTTDEKVTSVTYGTNNALPTATTISRGDSSLNLTTNLTYDNNGNVLTTLAPGKSDPTYTFYDNLNRPQGTISPDPDGSSGTRPRMATLISYNTDGKAYRIDKGTTTGTGASDLAGLGIATTDITVYDPTTGLATQAQHYDNGTLTQVTQTSYDANLRVQCVAQRLNSSIYGSLPSSACTLGAAGGDGNDRITYYSYNNDNTLKYQQSGYGSGNVRTDVTNSYDGTSGLLTSVADANGNTTGYYYDTFDRLTKTCYPTSTAGATINTNDCFQSVYASNGRLDHTITRDNQTINFGYDAAGRVNSKSGAITESIGYDNFNNVVTHTNNSQTETYTYNSLGQLLSDTGPLGAVSYDYDSLGRRSKLTWPNSGLYVTYGYDVGDELTGIYENGSAAIVTLDYDDYGRRWHLNRASGQTTTYGYDTSSRLTSLGNGSANTLSLSYTAANQVKSAANTWLPSYNGTAGTTSYATNGLNQITSVNSGSSFAYDGRGNLSGDGSGSTYTYNVLNLLTSATQSGLTSTLTYDAESRLLTLSKQNGGTTQFQYDGTDLIAEYDGSGNVLRRYVSIPGSDQPLVWYEGSGAGTKRYFYANNQGSITGITDSSGNLNATYSYDEYGLQKASGSWVSRFQYTGQTWLPEVGMYYYKARLYNPAIGRFMQTDSSGYTDGMNWYNYVHGDPVNNVDHTGKTTVFITGGGEMSGLSYPAIRDYVTNVFSKDFPNEYVMIVDHAHWDISQIENAADYYGGSLNIVGYSWGGPEAMKMAGQLAKDGFDVSNLITIDPVGNCHCDLNSDTADRWTNIFTVGHDPWQGGLSNIADNASNTWYSSGDWVANLWKKTDLSDYTDILNSGAASTNHDNFDQLMSTLAQDGFTPFQELQNTITQDPDQRPSSCTEGDNSCR
jgi:RHS repeat-associated protein